MSCSLELTTTTGQNYGNLINGIDHTLYADIDGNINFIFWFNLPGRIIHWIKSCLDDSVERRLQEAIVTLLNDIQTHQLIITGRSNNYSDINFSDSMTEIFCNSPYFQSNSEADQRIRALAQTIIVESSNWPTNS